MDLQTQYENIKAKMLNDNSVCFENKKWFKQVLEYQENKGKRKNGIPKLDNACYKTLFSYCGKMKRINEWFNNKPLKDITEKEFKRVYDDLEEGKIKTKNGKIFEDRTSYYSKIFKSKPFEMIGKDIMAKKIIEYNVRKDKNVRFIPNFKESLRDLVQNAINPSHKLLIQIQGDWGENIFTALQLEKKDFERVIDNETKEPYYLLNLHKGILKRTRTPRREYNIFTETLNMLDKYLENLKSNDKLFNFELRQAEIMFKRAVEKSKIKLQNGETPTLKDLRSSMACYLLNEGWTTDDIKGRLGHKPSSDVLDVYVSYLALNKNKVKKKIYEGNLEELKQELERYKLQSKKDREESEKIREENKIIKQDIKHLISFFEDFNKGKKIQHTWIGDVNISKKEKSPATRL
ncbi:MAG: hypothetical protein ABIH65_04015 [Nanoarchaeota archaeon]